MKTSENTKEDPEPADEGLVVQPKCRSNNKNYLQELMSVYVPSDNLEYLVIQHLSGPI
jgi:hypothetical protein